MEERKTITKKEADCLLKRYYEGATTNEEERLLRMFLSSSVSEDKIYDADRAVMGLFCVARHHRRAHFHCRKTVVWAVAAAVLLLLAGLWSYRSVEHAECIAYIRGEKCMDKEVVLQKMSRTLQAVARDDAAPTVESQMKVVFNTDISGNKGE